MTTVLTLHSTTENIQLHNPYYCNSPSIIEIEPLVHREEIEFCRMSYAGGSSLHGMVTRGTI